MSEKADSVLCSVFQEKKCIENKFNFILQNKQNTIYLYLLKAEVIKATFWQVKKKIVLKPHNRAVFTWLSKVFRPLLWSDRFYVQVPTQTLYSRYKQPNQRWHRNGFHMQSYGVELKLLQPFQEFPLNFSVLMIMYTYLIVFLSFLFSNFF